ncbi:MAG: PAS domain-containing protein [Alphaproteobacteria bacterium]|nr:PAS domain-containing protein [Alphaproteobacteria bacterium]
MMQSRSDEDHLLNLRSVIDSASDAIFVTEPADSGAAGHRILHVNPAFIAQTGYKVADAVGRPPTLLFGPNTDPAAEQCVLRALDQGEAVSLSALHYRKDGSDYWSQLSIQPMVFQGECRHCVAFLRGHRDEPAADAALAACDNRFLQLADGLSEAILVHRELRPIFVNRAYLNLFGYKTQTEALRENGPLLNFARTHRTTLSEMSVNPGEFSAPLAFDAIGTDGQKLQLEARWQAIDWCGAPAVLMTIRRIESRTVPQMLRRQMARRSLQRTAPNLPESALAESRRLLELLANSVPVLFAYKDRDLNFKFVNQAFANSVNLTCDAIVGLNVSDLRGQEHADAFKDKREAVFAGETVTFTTTREIAGLGDRDLIVTMVPHMDRNGDVVGYFTLSQDITEMKGIERALAERQEQLRLVMDSVTAMISYRDRNLVYRYVNKAAEEWLGRPADDIVGRHTSEITDLTVLQSVKPYLDSVLAGETVQFEQIFPLQELGDRTLLVGYVPQQDEDGRVIGFFTISQDITLICAGREALGEVENQFTPDIRAALHLW